MLAREHFKMGFDKSDLIEHPRQRRELSIPAGTHHD
jgi:hypothetical protein